MDRFFWNIGAFILSHLFGKHSVYGQAEPKTWHPRGQKATALYNAARDSIAAIRRVLDKPQPELPPEITGKIVDDPLYQARAEAMARGAASGFKASAPLAGHVVTKHARRHLR